jgi:hypothetical protein
LGFLLENAEADVLLGVGLLLAHKYHKQLPLVLSGLLIKRVVFSRSVTLLSFPAVPVISVTLLTHGISFTRLPSF